MPGYILTGTPGAGKTSVLRLLEVDGHPVVEEAATDVITLHFALGHDDPWRHPAFIDRVTAECVYEPTVFLIRRAIQNTAARRISFENSLAVERIHEQTYRDLGFHLVEIPAGPLPKRAALIQRTVERLRR